MKIRILNYLLVMTLTSFITTKNASAQVFESSSVKETKRIISHYKKKNIPYKFSKYKKNTVFYQLLLEDYKAYRNTNVLRGKRFIYRNKLYYIQKSSTKLPYLKKAQAIYIKKGFSKRHLLILKRKGPMTVFRVTRLKNKKPQEEDQSLVTFQMAQTRIRAEYGTGTDESFTNTYGNVLTGLEISHPSYLIKTLGRVEFYEEDYQESVVELDETYITTQLGSAQLTLGKQLFSWGAFDEFSTFDRVNIKNTQRFVFDSGENFRRPVTATRLEMYKDSFKLDTFIDFGLESGRKIVRNSRFGYINPETGKVRGADPEIVPPSLIQNTETSFKGRDKISYGARLSYSGNFDFSLNYLKAYNDFPMVTVSDTLRYEILLNSISLAGLAAGMSVEYFQEEIIGMDLTKTIGGQLYKMELAYINDSPTLDETLELKTYDKTRISIGGDYELDTLATTITWQIVNQNVITSEEILMNKELTQAIIQSSTDTMLDKGRYGARLIANTSDESYYISPFFDYDYNDNLTLGINYHFFSGDDYSFFGSNKDDNFINFKLRYLF